MKHPSQALLGYQLQAGFVCLQGLCSLVAQANHHLPAGLRQARDDLLVTAGRLDAGSIQIIYNGKSLSRRLMLHEC